MNEPMRLVDELEPGFERELLAAARNERAPRELRERVVIGVLGASALAVPIAAASPPSPLLAAGLKWLAIGAAAGGMTSAIGAVALSSAPEQPAAIEPSRLEAPRAASPVIARALPPLALEPVEVVPRARSSAPVAGTVVIGSPALAHEARSLDRVERLARSDRRGALAELERHDARFASHGVLGERSRKLRARLEARTE